MVLYKSMGQLSEILALEFAPPPNVILVGCRVVTFSRKNKSFLVLSEIFCISRGKLPQDQHGTPAHSTNTALNVVDQC